MTRFFITCCAVASAVVSMAAVPAGIYREGVPSAAFAELGNRPEFRSVIAIETLDGRLIGSGVLVAPQWVLTAAHVLPAEGAPLRIRADSTFVDVERVVVHPQYHGIRDSAYVDLALLHLVRTAGDHRVAALTGQPVRIGMPFVSVGYGRRAGARDPQATASGTRHGVENVIDTMGVGAQPRSFLGADLDNPTDSTMSTTGHGSARPLEGILNGGDSGGGMFVRIGRRWLLAGIGASTEHDRRRLEAFDRFGYYGSLSFWTRLDDQRRWVAQHAGR